MCYIPWLPSRAEQAAANWYATNIRDLILHDKAFTRGTFNNIKRDFGSLEVQLIDTDSYTPFIDHIEQVAGFIRGLFT